MFESRLLSLAVLVWCLAALPLLWASACFRPALEPDSSEVEDGEVEDRDQELSDDSESEDTFTQADSGGSLGAPQFVSASVDKVERVSLEWGRVEGADGYHVYRDGQRISNAEILGTTYVDDSAPGPDSVWGPPTGVAASTHLHDRVDVTWLAPQRPSGPDLAYRITAVANGVEGPASEVVVGRRLAPALARFEVEVHIEGAEPTWTDIGGTLTDWTHTIAPAANISIGDISASRADYANRVALSLSNLSVSDGIPVTYRVRGVLQNGDYIPASQPAVGQRKAGVATFTWQRSAEPDVAFQVLGQSESPQFDDSAPTPEGGQLYYRVEVTADGADPVMSGVTEGWGLVFSELAVGANFVCGRTPLVPDGGRVWCWGGNEAGQLGSAPTGDVHGPRRVEGLSGIAKVAAAARNACAVDVEGRLWCWGRSGNLFEVAESGPQTIAGPEGVKDLVLVGSTVACVSTETRVFCWGQDFNSYGLLGDGTVGMSRFAPAEVIDTTSTPLPGLKFAAGGPGYHMCGHAGSEVFCWGRNAHLQLGPETQSALSSRAVSISLNRGVPRGLAVTAATSCGLWETGLYCWGARFDGEPNSATPRLLDSGRGWRVLGAGFDHLCIGSESVLACMGENQQGQLGTGTVQPETTLRVLGDFSQPSTIVGGNGTTCALDAGLPWCWGYNGNQFLQVEATDTLVLQPGRVSLPE